MHKQAESNRDEFMDSSFGKVSADVLVAILLSSGEAVSRARHIIKARLSEGKCSLAEIDEWIRLFTDFASTKARAIREFWNLLRSAGHKFAPEQLVRFACVFGKGKGGRYYDDVAAALFAHPKTTAEHILGVIIRAPQKRKEAFGRLVEKNPSIMTLLACVRFLQITELAFRELKNRSDRPEDEKNAKKILLSGLGEIKVNHSDFELLCKWDLLSEAELRNMVKKTGTRQLALGELKERRIRKK